MARIRSIKPEFFTSEVIAALPLSARLTFIGLWTYVDDNGVGLDNERLILAAVWPLEDDITEAIRRTREDLRSLSGAGLVARYTDGQRRLIHISSWDEHQKVSHPRKPRYPLPSEAVTSPNGTPEILRSHSGNPPEPLRRSSALSREQGAGSRDLQDAARPAADEPQPAPPGPAVNQRAKTITDAYYEAEPMCKWPAVNAVVIRALKDGRWPDDQVRAALLRMAAENRSVTIDALRTELNGFPPPRSGTGRRIAEKEALFDRAMQRAEGREHDPHGNGNAGQVRQRALPPAGD